MIQTWLMDPDPSPPTDHTENMTEDQFMPYLLRWYVLQDASIQAMIVAYINRCIEKDRAAMYDGLLEMGEPPSSIARALAVSPPQPINPPSGDEE